VQEANTFVVGAGLRGITKQLEAEGLQALHFGLYVLYLESYVVDALAFFPNKFGYRTGIFSSFQELYFGIPGLEKGSANPFGGHFFGFVAWGV